MDHSKLGGKETDSLSAGYAHGKNHVFQLPIPAVSSNSKKQKMCYFAYDPDDLEYFDITKAAMTNLIEQEDGKAVINHYDCGDIKVFIPNKPLLVGQEKSMIGPFFEKLDAAAEKEQQLAAKVIAQPPPAQLPCGQQTGESTLIAQSNGLSQPSDHGHDVPIGSIVQSPVLPLQPTEQVHTMIARSDGPSWPPDHGHDVPMGSIMQSLAQPLQPAASQAHTVAQSNGPSRPADHDHDVPMGSIVQSAAQPLQPAAEQAHEITVIKQAAPAEPSWPPIYGADDDSDCTISLGSVDIFDDEDPAAPPSQFESEPAISAVYQQSFQAPASKETDGFDVTPDQLSPVHQTSPGRSSVPYSSHQGPVQEGPVQEWPVQESLPHKPYLRMQSYWPEQDMNRRTLSSSHPRSSYQPPPREFLSPYRQDTRPSHQSYSSHRSR
ncbi:hypothetical protein PILCRDRAFT_13226 [Piloderma croceum F 1598]|uniref:Uncharacterized protein n=1 Tax=Piloderma croceum (strain F 1598) TaxID=765440 RepID=A0A0C3ETI8_PILCF|nr:hypothetical protein PILCRDRAFT_13226 [Piloderma croceum F 1598]